MAPPQKCALFISHQAATVPGVTVATEAQQDVAVDWAEMRALYCKGISLSDLARKFGINASTIRARSSREKWHNTVARVNEHVLQGVTQDLTASAKSWIGRMDKVVHAGLDNVTAKGIDKLNLKDLSMALDCIEKANRIARQTYGLDKADGQHTHIHLGLVGSSNGMQRSVLALSDNIIDVTPEPKQTALAEQPEQPTKPAV